MSMQIAPYRGAVAITKSDATIIPVTRAIYVGGAGNVAVRMANGTTATFTAAVVGQILPLAVDKVLDTGTTATVMLALY